MPKKFNKPTGDLSRLLVSLNNSRIQNENPALYETIRDLIHNTNAISKTVTTARNTVSDTPVPTPPPIGSSPPPVPAISDADYLTFSDETPKLPNSRWLQAGTNVSFDDTIPGIRKINATGGGSSGTSGIDYVVASDGVTPTPSPLNDGFGNFIYVAYTP